MIVVRMQCNCSATATQLSYDCSTTPIRLLYDGDTLEVSMRHDCITTGTRNLVVSMRHECSMTATRLQHDGDCSKYATAIAVRLRHDCITTATRLHTTATGHPVLYYSNPSMGPGVIILLVTSQHANQVTL